MIEESRAYTSITIGRYMQVGRYNFWMVGPICLYSYLTLMQLGGLYRPITSEYFASRILAFM